MTAPTISLSPTNAALPTKRSLPLDFLILLGVTVALWVVTFLWLYSGVGQAPTNVTVTETDAWLLAISGLMAVPLIVQGIVSVWGVILGIPTALSVVHIVLRRHPRSLRWGVAGTLTAAVFVVPPMLLNRFEQARLAKIYQARDAQLIPLFGGRAVELPWATPLTPGWRGPFGCIDECLDILTFGKAKVVTRSFIPDKSDKDQSLVVQSFVLGRIGQDCGGLGFKGYCAKAVEHPLEAGRLEVRIEPVRPVGGDQSVVARRLLVTDTAMPKAQPSQLTAFAFGRYTGLLNVASRNGGFYLPKGAPPVLVEEKLDQELYRRVLPNTLDGEYYPFR
jgi:hypothetical protein